MTRARNMDRRCVTTVLVVVSLAAASSHAQDRHPAARRRPAATMTPVIAEAPVEQWPPRLDRRAARAARRANELARAGRHRCRPAGAAMGSRASRRRCSPRAPALALAVEIADALDALLANLSSSSAVDSTSLQLYVPVRRLPEALPLMADVAQRPTFPTQGLETLKQQRLVMLRNARDDPDAIAALAFARGSYGPSHRSSRRTDRDGRQHPGLDTRGSPRLSRGRLPTGQQHLDLWSGT